MYSVWSTVYLEQDVDKYTCYVKEDEWNRVNNDIPTKRLFARITKGDLFWICALGPPIRTDLTSHEKQIFIPTWMLEQINSDGSGEMLEVDWMPSEVFDHTEHIILQPFDSAYQNGDIQEQLSIELTKLAILQKNTRIVIKMPELDNYEVTFQVKELKPASVVLCHGDDVTIEFERSLDMIDNEIHNERVPTPYPMNELPTHLEPSAPVEPSAPRFNPWRNKDFKPNVS